MVQLSHTYMTTRKTIALTMQTFVGKVMSLLFNMLSRFVIAFLPRNKCLNFMAAVTIRSDFKAQENKVSHYFHCSPIYLPWSDRTRCRDLSFLNVEVFFFLFIFISWRLITSQHFSGFCHTLAWISHGVTCIPHPDPPSHLPLHLIPLGLPSAPGPSTCLMHSTWAGDLFHYK